MRDAPILILTTSRRLNYFKETIASFNKNIDKLGELFKEVWLLDDKSSPEDRLAMEMILKSIFKDQYQCVYFNNTNKLRFIDKLNFIKKITNPVDIIFYLEDDWVLSEPLDLHKHIHALKNSTWTQISFADPLFLQPENIQTKYKINDEYWKNPFPEDFIHPYEWNVLGEVRHVLVRMNNWGGNPSLIKAHLFHEHEFSYHPNFEALFADIKTRNQVFHQKCFFRHIGVESLIEKLHIESSIQNTIKSEDIPGWFSYQWIYDLFVNEAKTGNTIVEIGSWFGKSTKYLTNKISESGKDLNLICIDTFKGSLNEEVHQNIVQNKNIYSDFFNNLYGSKLSIIKDSSHNAAQLFQNGSIDYLMIDGDHSYEGVQNDLQDYFYKVKPGGIISGDDYKAFETVVHATNDFFLKAQTVTEDYLHWYYRIPKIQVIHISTTPTQSRALTSIANIKELSRYNVDIKYIQNPKYSGPIDMSWHRYPNQSNINQAHYGCYLAHKQAIYSMSDDYGYTIIMEEDAYILENLKTFMDVVHKAIFSCITHNAYFVSFGTMPLESELKPFNSYFMECWHQSLAHCYMIPNKHKQWYMNKYETNPWNVADLWFNHIFCHDRQLRLLTKQIYAKQLDGFSLIDNVQKTY